MGRKKKRKKKKKQPKVQLPSSRVDAVNDARKLRVELEKGLSVFGFLYEKLEKIGFAKVAIVTGAFYLLLLISQLFVDLPVIAIALIVPLVTPLVWGKEYEARENGRKYRLSEAVDNEKRQRRQLEAFERAERLRLQDVESLKQVASKPDDEMLFVRPQRDALSGPSRQPFVVSSFED